MRINCDKNSVISASKKKLRQKSITLWNKLVETGFAALQSVTENTACAMLDHAETAAKTIRSYFTSGVQ